MSGLTPQVLTNSRAESVHLQDKIRMRRRAFLRPLVVTRNRQKADIGRSRFLLWSTQLTQDMVGPDRTLSAFSVKADIE
jgi:hypothetical protein